MSGVTAARSDNLRGAGWLVADMALNIWALSIVKAMGAEYPAAQIVFLRVVVGLVVILPWVWRDRAAFRGLENRGLHLVRVALSATTLLASFFAIARVPFAVFTAINFTRPILLMVLAALLLHERIPRGRWWAAAVALLGALVAVSPGAVAVGGLAGPGGGPGTGPGGGISAGVVALCVAVTTGTLAIILTRRLKGTAPVVMMLVYTAGIAAVTAPLAAWSWQPVAPAHWPILLLVGVFAQVAQLCFLKAHWLGDAGVLGAVSYLSLVLSTAAGFFVFGEVPGWPLLAGAALILGANLIVTRTA